MGGAAAVTTAAHRLLACMAAARSPGRSRMKTKTMTKTGSCLHQRRACCWRANRDPRRRPRGAAGTPVALSHWRRSAPSTTPRRSPNQRVATTAASTIDVTPFPRPPARPHSSRSPSVCIRVDTPPRPSAARARIIRRDAVLSIHHRCRERTNQAKQGDVDGDRRRSLRGSTRTRPRAANLRKSPWRERRRSQQHLESDRRDHPRVVHALKATASSRDHHR